MCPNGIACSELSGECLKCNLNPNCVYGMVYIANCSISEHIDCVVSNIEYIISPYPLHNILQLIHWNLRVSKPFKKNMYVVIVIKRNIGSTNAIKKILVALWHPLDNIIEQIVRWMTIYCVWDDGSLWKTYCAIGLWDIVGLLP